jgi:hypothetical protein
VYAEMAALDSNLIGTHGRVAGAGTLEQIHVELVSGTYFDTLGLNPVLGRLLHQEDDRTPGAHPLAAASYSWWQRRLAGNRGAIGTTVSIGSTTYTIVGQSPDLWIPMAMERQISPGWNGLENKRFQSLYLLARRRPGVDTATASADTNLLFQQILLEYLGPQPSARQLDDIRHARIELTSAATGLSQIPIHFSSPRKTLLAVVAVLLLIACANLANLLLARARLANGRWPSACPLAGARAFDSPAAARKRAASSDSRRARRFADADGRSVCW